VKLAAPLRAGILAASRSGALRAFAAGHGMRFGAARFVAGTTLDDFVEAARRANARGIRVAAGYLGEGVRDASDAARIAREFTAILDRIAAERLDANLALKLSHVGLDADAAEAERNVREIVAHAARLGNSVRVDMEESWRVAPTLELYRRLRSAGLDNVGVVLQAYLRRSPGDLDALAPLAPNVRLVKGAYLEPPSLAFATRREIDRNYLALIETALRSIPFTAIATHDDEIIEEAIVFARRHNLRRAGRFEFQMLLGVREPLQARLVARGYPVRVSVPFGADWYPYLMRRMAENPANLALILRNWRG
jgi:proline dehydrogenase